MRKAISAGALALALSGGIPMVVATSAGATAQADCGNGGLLGGITGGLCKAVGTVGTVVDGLADTVAPPAPRSGGSDAAGATAVNDTEEAAPGATAPADEPAADSLLPKALDDVCVPLVASPECTSPSAISAPEETEQPSTRSHPRPARTGKPKPAERNGKKAAPLPTEPVRPPQNRTRTTDTDEPVIPQPSPVVDPEAPRVELLWPGPVMQEFQRRMPDERPVTPTRSSDTLGTALTTALLIVAILAVRVLYAKRAGEESMPFEPLRVGRHRTA
ncbi:hypothetical protein ACQPYK_30750 [Streptosporangium sp. CA-135522]|uniref:hypothetical protein n=1 Tax=Streptosporangium sp. CA-135522 TaxID=3240072 RepID=UPI003D8BE71F